MKRINERGMSLLEVLASVALLSVVASAFTLTTVNSIKSNKRSKDISAASALVHDKIEDLRALDPAGNPADLTAGSHSDPLNPISPLGVNGGKFTRAWGVTANTPKTGMSLIVVTVTWTTQTTRSVSGSTYVCASSTCS